MSGQRFDDVRTEWRINDIERALHQKADNHEIHSLRGTVDRLEHSMRDLGSMVDGLRSELKASQEENRRLIERLEILESDQHDQ